MKKLMRYPAILASVLLAGFYSCAEVDELSDENRVTSFVLTGFAPSTAELGDPVIIEPENTTENSTIQIPILYGADGLSSLKFNARLTYSGTIDQVLGVDFGKEQELTGLDTNNPSELSFTVLALSGLPRTYKVVPVWGKFEIPEEIPFEVKSVTPSGTEFEENAVVNGTVMTLTVFNATFPLSVTPEFEFDPAEIGFPGFANGETELVFANADAVNNIVIADVKNGSKRDVTVKLKAIELDKEGFEVTSFEITSLSSTFAASGVDIVNTEGSNAQPGNIVIKLSSPGILPVKVGYRMRLSKNATADIELNGEMSFASLDEVKGFNVTGPDSEVKAWEVSIAEFTPQLLNGNLDGNWTKADWSNYYLYPNPVGREGWPYWSNANMNLVVKIEATQRTEKGNGYAARLQTVEVNAIIIKKIAAGSLFLGWFDADNATRYMNDPTRLTFMGIPFCASKKIAGLKVDFTYTSGGSPTTDSGSIGIQLVNHDQKEKPYVYHGLNKTGDGPHADNTAVKVAAGMVVMGNAPVGTVVTNGDTIGMQVTAGQWYNDVLIPLEYEGEYPEYTHLVFTSSSSSRGDQFKATPDSILILDNIRIVYEGDQ